MLAIFVITFIDLGHIDLIHGGFFMLERFRTLLLAPKDGYLTLKTDAAFKAFNPLYDILLHNAIVHYDYRPGYVRIEGDEEVFLCNIVTPLPEEKLPLLSESACQLPPAQGMAACN